MQHIIVLLFSVILLFSCNSGEPTLYEELKTLLSQDDEYAVYQKNAVDLRNFLITNDMKMIDEEIRVELPHKSSFCSKNINTVNLSSSTVEYLSLFFKNIALTESLLAKYPGLKQLSKEDRIDLLFKTKGQMITPSDLKSKN